MLIAIDEPSDDDGHQDEGLESRDDEHLTLSQAARTLPGTPHLSTLHRWRLRGVRGVRLRTCLVGGRRYTTRRWLCEFQQATTAAGDTTPSSEPREDRSREIHRAEAELAADGI